MTSVVHFICFALFSLEIHYVIEFYFIFDFDLYPPTVVACSIHVKRNFLNIYYCKDLDFMTVKHNFLITHLVFIPPFISNTPWCEQLQLLFKGAFFLNLSVSAPYAVIESLAVGYLSLVNTDCMCMSVCVGCLHLR